MSAPDDLRALYQETILDHNRRPRNFGALEGASGQGAGYNPLCGDRVVVYLRTAGDRVADISFEGAGCAISTASASMMTEALKGKTLAEARALFERFHALLTTGGGGEDLGMLAAFAGVREFPMRVKCATLAWHALSSALPAAAQPADPAGPADSAEHAEPAGPADTPTRHSP
jgi:nitrogen fixation NifU-like protein